MPVTRRAALAAFASLLLVSGARFSPAQAGPRILGVDQTGKPVDDTRFGGWRLVYFGYTHCPDVCPLGLQTMAEVIDALGPLGARLDPIFITVDPDRDTPAVMAEYVVFFHPRLVGVSPTPDELKSMALAWRIKYAKVDLGEGRDYLMDHTATILLIDPAGAIAGRFSHNMPGAQMATKVRSVLEARP